MNLSPVNRNKNIINISQEILFLEAKNPSSEGFIYQPNLSLWSSFNEAKTFLIILKHEGAIEIVREYPEGRYSDYSTFAIKIKQPRFKELYEETTKTFFEYENTALNSSPKKLTQKEVKEKIKLIAKKYKNAKKMISLLNLLSDFKSHFRTALEKQIPSDDIKHLKIETNKKIKEFELVIKTTGGRGYTPASLQIDKLPLLHNYEQK